MVNCLRTSADIVGSIRRSRQPGQLRHDEKTYASEIKATYQTFGTVTIPAADTTPMCLPADASASWRIMVFAILDNFIVMGQPLPVYRDSLTLASILFAGF